MLANLFSVKIFGELEFWFSIIKVVTIILLIVTGLSIIFWELLIMESLLEFPIFGNIADFLLEG